MTQFWMIYLLKQIKLIKLFMCVKLPRVFILIPISQMKISSEASREISWCFVKGFSSASASSWAAWNFRGWSVVGIVSSCGATLEYQTKRRKIKRVPVKLKWAENFGEMSTNIYQHFRDGIIMSSKYSEIFGRRALKYVYHWNKYRSQQFLRVAKHELRAGGSSGPQACTYGMYGTCVQK